MPNLDPEKRKRGLKFANDLAVFASKAPDIHGEAKVNKLVAELLRYYGWSRDLKMEAIRQYLQQQGGTLSVHEIAAHFDWHAHKVKNLVDEMEQKGLVEFYSATPAGLGPGRPSSRIHLLNGKMR